MSSISDTEREERLDEVLAEYLKAVQVGSAPSRQELLAKYPDLANDLAEYFADRDRFDRMATPLRGVVPARTEVLRDFGDYEILEEIARGGMGVVYKARQKSLRRIVALKMLLAGRFASYDDVQRFRTEAEAVASLDHPSIVPIFEVGWREGRPYLCMKFLGGGSLAQKGHDRTQKIEGGREGQKAIARQMIAIAGAVHYAHQHGILHRDLKPANILLDDQGQPHVSDFGLAKRQRTSPETMAAPLTHTGAIVGTPAYMAPEQASGQRGCTVAADVYGLGTILYELLTGRAPFKADSPLETLRLVLERDPERPSSYRRGIDRDLETICLKCLQKEPARRYASAAELAADLQRFVEGRPIHARPIGSLRRLFRWVRRQPVIAGLTFAVAILLLGGLGVVSWMWLESERHRLQAERNYQESERHRQEAERLLAESDTNFRLADQAVKEFCLRVSDQLGQFPGTQRLRKALLESGITYLRGFLERRKDDPRLKLELADTWIRIGDLTKSIGRKTDAIDAYRQAIVLYTELQKANPEEIKHKRKLASLHRNLPPLLGRLDEGLAAAQETRRVYEHFLADHPDDRELLSGLAGALNDVSTRFSTQGDVQSALLLAQKAVDILERLVERYPRDRGIKHELTSTLNNLAVYQPRNATGWREALRLLTRMKGLNEELVVEHNNSPVSRANLASACYNLAATLNNLGRTRESRDELQRCLDLREKIVQEEADVTRYQTELAYTLLESGRKQKADGQPETALATFERSYRIYEGVHLLEPANLSYRHGMGMARFYAGELEWWAGQKAEAAEHLSEARKLLAVVVREDGENIIVRHDFGRTENYLGLTLANLGKVDQARTMLLDSVIHLRLAWKRAPHVEQHRRSLDSALDSLAQVERHNGHPDGAVTATLERQKLWSGNGRELFRAGRDLAAAASEVDNPKTKWTTQKKEEARKEYADLALKALEEAVLVGYRNLNAFEKDPFLKSVRDRSDFKQLVERVRKGQPPS
jgi:serine/threonine-protein kinase